MINNASREALSSLRDSFADSAKKYPRMFHAAVRLPDLPVEPGLRDGALDAVSGLVINLAARTLWPRTSIVHKPGYTPLRWRYAWGPGGTDVEFFYLEGALPFDMPDEFERLSRTAYRMLPPSRRYPEPVNRGGPAEVRDDDAARWVGFVYHSLRCDKALVCEVTLDKAEPWPQGTAAPCPGSMTYLRLNPMEASAHAIRRLLDPEAATPVTTPTRKGAGRRPKNELAVAYALGAMRRGATPDEAFNECKATFPGFSVASPRAMDAAVRRLEKQLEEKKTERRTE
jgi:hypothetical protein